MTFEKASEQQLTEIEKIYDAAFPEDEREPFSLLRDLKDYLFYALCEDGKVCAFAAIIEKSAYIVIDYLAVSADARGRGFGSKIISECKNKYRGKAGLFIEIERLGEGPASENAIRARRHAFYLKNGFTDFGVNIVFDGVKMQLMVLPLKNVSATTDDYFAAFRGLGSPKRERIFLDGGAEKTSEPGATKKEEPIETGIAGASACESEVAEILAGAVRFRTVADAEGAQEAFDACFVYYEKTFPTLFSSCFVTRINNGFLLKIPGMQTAPQTQENSAGFGAEAHAQTAQNEAGQITLPGLPVLLMAHTDVVDAFGEWTHAPFDGIVADGRVWGRGSVDTKGTLCCILFAAEKFLLSGRRPKRDVYILSTANEEIAGPDGPAAAQWFRDKNIRLGYVLDEGGAVMTNPIAGVEGTFAMIALSERASAKYEIVAEGKNKAAQMGKFLSRIESLRVGKPYFSPEVRALFRTLTPYMKGGMRFAFQNLWLTMPLIRNLLPKLSPEAKAMVLPTFAVSNAPTDGADKKAKTLSVTVNAARTYYVPQQKIDAALGKLCAKCGVTCRSVLCRDTVPPEPTESVGYRFTASLVRASLDGVQPCPFILFGGTDSRHFAELSDSVIRFAPIALDAQQFSSFHDKDENISVAALDAAERFYARLLEFI